MPRCHMLLYFVLIALSSSVFGQNEADPLAATKKAVNAATLGGLGEAFQRERAGQAVLLRTDDVAEGMRAFAEKRRPEFQGR